MSEAPQYVDDAGTYGTGARASDWLGGGAGDGNGMYCVIAANRCRAKREQVKTSLGH